MLLWALALASPGRAQSDAGAAEGETPSKERASDDVGSGACERGVETGDAGSGFDARGPCGAEAGSRADPDAAQPGAVPTSAVVLDSGNEHALGADAGVGQGESPSAPAPAAIAVTVRGQLTAREQLRRSSEAVTLVDLRQAKRRSSDLSEVLSRVAGISMRRYGGLGSDFRFSLNGLYDTQIRFFIDGVPLDRVHAVGLANLPINLIEDVEIYRGVVPLRFGADALGGAVNLVTAADYETALQASYQVGSFGIQRGTLAARYRHEPTGIIAGVEGFIDRADNDYWVDVEIPDAEGTPQPARVRRFHDGYSAYGVSAEVGVTDRAWARRLLARGFFSSYAKELQNNIVMTVPYGEPHYGERLAGALLRYGNSFARRYDLDVVASYSHRTIDFVDKGRWIYDWRGERIGERLVPGEIEARPRDQTVWQHGAFARATLDVRLAPGHALTLSASPNYATRTGDQQVQLDPDARDPLTAERELFKLVSGLSYTTRFVPLTGAPAAEQRRPQHYRVENVLFGKSYLYRVDSEEPRPGDVFLRRDAEKNAFGAGDMLRVTLLDDYLLAKASYEYATRLPETDEVFGNGVLIEANLELAPETSHNANLGPQLDLRGTKAGDFWLDVNAFFRDSRDLIVLLGRDRNFTYENVRDARSLGVESSAKWTSPGRYATLDAQLTYMDLRNTSSRGLFADFEGDRIPNRPWLFASWGGFLRFDSVFWEGDRIEPFYQGRYVYEFYRSWASVGLRDFKQIVPTQLSHGLGVTYAVRVGRATVYGTFDVQNVTDAELYDSFGVQRPGRGYYFKLVAEL